MANIIYPLIIFLFVIGATMTMINETGLYSQKLPETGLATNTSQASEFNEALVQSSTDANTFNIESLFLLGKCLIGGLTAIFTLGPLLTNIGVPGGVILWILSPLGIVLVFWMVEMWLGRSVE